jgi:glycolate oxidase iron-sulfur subunit
MPDLPAPESREKESQTHKPLAELLTNCVHCGLCLDVCPTYKLTGDENNSPRGRLRLWRKEEEGVLADDPLVEHYTSECVSCLACEPACPANVPYGTILETVRHQQMQAGRARPKWYLKLAARLVHSPRAFQWLSLPGRWLRQMGLLKHPFMFPGQPATWQSTSAYAQQLMRERQPTGPHVALLTGCLMEGMFRELNFATVRVLIANNVRVTVPESQGCCGAFPEHLGLANLDALQGRNQTAFYTGKFDAVLSSSSGCGLALSKTLAGRVPVIDVLQFLSQLDLKPRPVRDERARLYVDLPCHLIHGQRVAGIPETILNATGYRWELAPMATECCGSGGTYNLQKPENSRQILARKAAFLETAVGEPVILGTSNHVCMMQWYSARTLGIVSRPFEVRHIIQLLDESVTRVV